MQTPWFSASLPLIVMFSVVVALTVAAFLGGLAVGARRAGVKMQLFALGVLVYLGVVVGLGQSGALLSFSLPPRPLMVFWGGFGLLAVALTQTSMKRAVAALPLGFWVLLQGFRLPLELVMHLAAKEKVMPVVMSYSGRNFDIVTGVLAWVVGYGLLKRNWPRWTAWAFNALGTALLVNVLTIAIFSMPSPLRRFVDDVPNVWVAYAPFVLLPGALVVLAAYAHYQCYRLLLDELFGGAAASGVLAGVPEASEGSPETSRE
jgi:hypothetical protein